MEWFDRTALLLGPSRLARLRRAHVLVVGLGGVGAYAAEQLCRAGIGEMTIVDGDRVDLTNKNRQLPALDSTIGLPKAEVLAARFRDINPGIRLHVVNEYLRDDAIPRLLALAPYDYLVDAIDTLAPKVALVSGALRLGIPVVSAMGAGGRLDPSLVQVADVSRSHDCRLARAFRSRLHRLGIRRGVTVVFSPEPVDPAAILPCDDPNKKSNVGTISYMPPLFGCHCAAVVIRALAGSPAPSADEPDPALNATSPRSPA